MASLYIVTMTLSLLILVAGQDTALEPSGEATMADVMRDVGHALQCFSDTTQSGLHTMQESLRLHKQNTDVLRDLHSLPDMMMQVKQEMQKNNENEGFLNRENEALKKVITLTQEINDFEIQIVNKNHEIDDLSQENMDLKNQLHNKDENVDILNEEIMQLKQELADKNETTTDLQTQLEDITNENEENAIRVQKLDWKLTEYERRVKRLEQENKDLTKIVETETNAGWKLDCEKPPESQQINQVVQTYINNRRWSDLRSGLAAVLDESTEAYKQLLVTGSLLDVGLNGDSELASLLLCAGIHVDMLDSGEHTMLHGAAYEGHLDMVKLLLERGASVDVKGQYDKTPLLTAAPRGHLEVIQWLVEAGANTTARDSWDRTALYWAQSYEQTEVVEYLEELPH